MTANHEDSTRCQECHMWEKADGESECARCLAKTERQVDTARRVEEAITDWVGDQSSNSMRFVAAAELQRAILNALGRVIVPEAQTAFLSALAAGLSASVAMRLGDDKVQSRRQATERDLGLFSQSASDVGR